jgi:hypothetical protein
MGPPLRKFIPAHSVRSLSAFLLILTVSFTLCLNLKFTGHVLCTKNKTMYTVVINNYIFQLAGEMESGAISCLTSEEATCLGDEAAASAAATAAAAASISGPVSGNGSPPASSGIVHTANLPIPHSERSTLIRINQEIKNKPTVFFWGGSPSSFGDMETFHSLGDGRVKRSVLVENMASFTIATTSFTPATWCCVSCSLSTRFFQKNEI